MVLAFRVGPGQGGRTGRPGYRGEVAGPTALCDSGSAGVGSAGQGGVVDDPAGLQVGVLGHGEADGDGLSLVGGQVEGLLGVGGVGADVGVGGQGGCGGGGHDLGLHGVVDGGAGLGGVATQPEGQGRVAGGRDGDGLVDGLGGGGAVAAEPVLPGSGA